MIQKLRLLACLLILVDESYSLIVQRSFKDSFHGTLCKKVKGHPKHQHSRETNCKCSTQKPIFASNESSHLTCASVEDLGCTKQFTIKTRRSIERFAVASSCEHDKVYIWNIYKINNLNISGEWVDVTDIALPYLYMDRYSKSLKIARTFPQRLWKGQLIKITFQCNTTSVLLKVHGRVTYPFDAMELNDFDERRFLNPYDEREYPDWFRKRKPDNPYGESEVIVVRETVKPHTTKATTVATTARPKNLKFSQLLVEN